MTHPTFTQPEALRLANYFDYHGFFDSDSKAAAELRRLHEANIDCVDHFNALKAERDELLEALRGALEHWPVPSSVCKDRAAYEQARAATAKATGDQA